MRFKPGGFWFDPVDSNLFFSRNDPSDPRLGERVHSVPAELADVFEDNLKNALMAAKKSETRSAVIAGYPDDEGIKINGGRLGAVQGPTEVRRFLYRMTPSLHGDANTMLFDIGDLHVEGVPLPDRHEAAAYAALTALNEGAMWIGIGGGHDYGYPDAAAFCEWCKANNQRPLVINFDAHLDVRPTTKGLSSGTPFFRMLEEFPETDFVEIGIQAHCNSRTHLEWVKSKGARVLTQEEIEASGEPMVTALIRLLDDWILRRRPVFISIDIDGFSSSVAPGCSQSWATGFMPREFFPCLEVLKRRLDVKVLGIYEVSPPLDHDMRTAKLAAQIIHRVIS